MSSVEKTCTGCGESWPDDKEFFFSGGHRRLMSVCKACYTETHRPAGSRSKPPKVAPNNCIPAAALQGVFHDLVNTSQQQERKRA